MAYSKAELALIEKAIIFASKALGDVDDLPKPVLLHSIRVGTWLYNHGYPANTIIAGYLHDVVEDTDTSQDDIAQAFNDEIATLVAANSKDTTITDSEARRKELIERTIDAGEQAAIVKAADILDNFYFYSAHDTSILPYCTSNARHMQQILPQDFNDPVFSNMFTTIL